MIIFNFFSFSKVVVMCARTGSGKSTRVPQFILSENPESFIVVTQVFFFFFEIFVNLKI